MRLRLFRYAVRVRTLSYYEHSERLCVGAGVEQRLQFLMLPLLLAPKNSFGTCCYRCRSSACRFWDLFFSLHFLPIFYVFVGLHSLIFIITFNGVGKECLLPFSSVSFRSILIRSHSLLMVLNANVAVSFKYPKCKKKKIMYARLNHSKHRKLIQCLLNTV